jgi:DnaJ-class molecular chaperone
MREGAPGLGGGPAGDALVTVHVRPHSLFRRQGKDIYIELPVALHEAVLGAKVRVPTIDGPVTMNIPKGSNTGGRLRLKGKGIPRGKAGGRGDQHVTLRVVLPDESDVELGTFLEDWSKRHNYDP